ncbi:alpha/beta fold hydrolase [Streptomyces cinnabarinus]|uniref:Alpha/beta fold hydrolase n=1 Tax=Streptomyces cinnabarinus TaxID=67287 RepID=A0ABY7KLP7_9ACTN|nr:alpha/beta fold hydrolase [Streptomyces cinnabarinus]WAZ24022.1 alpha/beta fold hydrolase [Streptomyces cinnabarinus]
MSVTTEQPWFPRALPGAPCPQVRLFCVPHGGAGGSVFRPWQSLLGPGTEVVPVQLPGREIRVTEPAERSVARLAERLEGPLARRAEGLPYVLFGHSMGALLAYELALALQESDRPPAALVVSGSVPPHVPRRTPAMHRLPDAEFVAGLRRLGGVPPELLADEEWLALFLPQLRADFEAAETYRALDALRPGIPLLALAGADDPAAAPDEVEHWRDLGTDVTVRVFDGDHFFVFTSAEAVLTFVARELAW